MSGQGGPAGYDIQARCRRSCHRDGAFGTIYRTDNRSIHRAAVDRQIADGTVYPS